MANLLRGMLRMSEDQCAEAAAIMGNNVQTAPDDPEAHFNLGLALDKLGRLDEAAACYRRAIEIKLDYADAHNNLGSVLTILKRPDEAIASIYRALALDPMHALAHYNLGNALSFISGLEEAACECYRRAIAIKPDHAESHGNLGAMLDRINRPAEVLDHLQHALALGLSSTNIYNFQGLALAELGRYDEAIDCYHKAIAIAPDEVWGHINESLVQLVKGDFEAGWQNYEWRWKHPDAQHNFRAFPQPLWRGGQALAGRTILLYAEQGIGDAIQFARYVPLVAQLGAQVLLEIPRELQDLFRGFAGAGAVFVKGEALPEFDLHCPLMSLPLAFKTSLDSIPGATPYLAAPRDRVARWSHELRAERGLKVGLVWAGNRAHKSDRKRSLPLTALAPLFELDGMRFYSLQKDVKAGDAATLTAARNLSDLAPDLGDFADTAAVIAQLDLVISADTAVAHLAGALDKPVWVLLPCAPDWRWLLDRADSPWYPGARLFRQPVIGDWDSVIRKVAGELRALNEAKQTARSARQ